MVKTPPKKVFWGGFGGSEDPFSGGTEGPLGKQTNSQESPPETPAKKEHVKKIRRQTKRIRAAHGTKTKKHRKRSK